MARKTRGNGEGSIFKRTKNGKTIWVAQYILYKLPNGRNKYKTFYGKTREEVKNKLENLIVELKTDKYVDKNSITLEMLAKSIIEDEYKLNKLVESSYLRKQYTLQQIQSHYIAKMELQQIQENDVKDFLAYISKYSNSTISKIYGVVNSTFKKAIKKNIIKYNFLDDKDEFDKPKSKRKDKNVRGFTVDEQKDFIEALKKDKSYNFHCQFLLSLYTGMRMGEINALSVSDIDLDNGIIHIRHTLTRDKNDKTIMGNSAKTKNGIRDIYINDQVKNILKDYLKNDYIENKENLLFYNSQNTYYSTCQVNSVFKRFCEHYDISLGYDVNQHMLRHTYATRCIESGMPANVVSKIMGHANIKTTLGIYCDVFNNYEKQHSSENYEYLKENNLLLDNKSDGYITKEDFDIIIKNINSMYENKDKKLFKIQELVK